MAIPVNDLVSVQPGVVGTGGSPLSLNGVVLSQSLRIPNGSLLSFPSAQAVQNYFGVGSAEANFASVYFLGFDNSQIKPGTLYVGPYNAAPDAAFLRGGSLSGMTLAQLQALNGSLTVTIDGAAKTAASINLSAATSFSNAASLIATALTAAPATVTFDSLSSAFQITSGTTGAASTITAATGTLAAGLGLTVATGAILSQGGVADTPATALNNAFSASQNWATFGTVFEPATTDKLAFAAWANSKNQRFLYCEWDTDITAQQSGNTTSFGPQAVAAAYNAAMPIWGTADKAAFAMGIAASIDFTQLNGRTIAAFRSQAGLTADVTDQTIAANLKANGYNFYGSYATANQPFVFLQNGQITGQWKWFDTYLDQIYLNSQLQLAIVTGLQQSRSVPYNADGYALIRAFCADPINQAINSGIIRTGIPLSASQAASVNAAAGLAIDKYLTANGYYLQVLPASAQVRGLRQSPPCTLWYTDGGSVQQINLASIDIQ